MMSFTLTVSRFEKKGEKTGWTYMEIPSDIAQRLKKGNKKSFRVKGFLDAFAISRVALLPIGEGKFIIPLNAAMRKGTGKKDGALITLRLEEDTSKDELNEDLLSCLTDEPSAQRFFESLSPSHRSYFSKWIESAKTSETKVKRILQTVSALARSMNYPSMMRALKEEKDKLG